MCGCSAPSDPGDPAAPGGVLQPSPSARRPSPRLCGPRYGKAAFRWVWTVVCVKSVRLWIPRQVTPFLRISGAYSLSETEPVGFNSAGGDETGTPPVGVEVLIAVAKTDFQRVYGESAPRAAAFQRHYLPEPRQARRRATPARPRTRSGHHPWSELTKHSTRRTATSPRPARNSVADSDRGERGAESGSRPGRLWLFSATLVSRRSETPMRSHAIHAHRAGCSQSPGQVPRVVSHTEPAVRPPSAA